MLDKMDRKRNIQVDGYLFGFLLRKIIPDNILDLKKASGLFYQPKKTLELRFYRKLRAITMANGIQHDSMIMITLLLWPHE